MKKSTKSRVSWPSDSMLCQVKMFVKEDCPAKVSSQSSTKKPKALFHLPPGFEATHYPTTTTSLNLSLLPRIKWHRPPKFIFDDDLLIATGGESTETVTENSRISKLMEAFYPHRSSIPSSPWVSRAVQEERYDDSKTPNITLVTIDDEPEATPQSSHSSKPAPDSALVASALLKTKEQGSLVDAELLVKFLTNPEIVMKLINGTPLETANITQPRSAPPNPVALPETKTRSHAVSLNPCVAVQSSVTVATHPPLHKPTQLVSMNHYPQKAPSMIQNYPLPAGPKPLPSLEDSYSTATLKPSPVDDVFISEPKPQAQCHNISTFSTGNMNRVQDSTDPQVRNGAYPVKNIEYYKNLIRLHGVASPATNETEHYKGRVDNNIKLVKVSSIQKPCKFFGRGRGCKLGEKCLYLHDHSKRVRTNAAAEFPRAKRLKFAT